MKESVAKAFEVGSHYRIVCFKKLRQSTADMLEHCKGSSSVNFINPFPEATQLHVGVYQLIVCTSIIQLRPRSESNVIYIYQCVTASVV
jgi:hypothetical protein